MTAPVDTIVVVAFNDTWRRRRSYQPAALYVDARRGLLLRLGNTVKAPAAVRYIILALAAARGEIVSREDLYVLVFGEDAEGGPTSLSPLMFQVKHCAVALGLKVEAHRGRGYSLGVWLERAA